MVVCRLWVGGQDVVGNSSPTPGAGVASVFPGDLAMEAAGHSHGVGSLCKSLRGPRAFPSVGSEWGHHFAFWAVG